MSALWKRSATELARRVRDREVTALEVADAHLERALRLSDGLRAFLHLEPDAVRRQARDLDRRIATGARAGLLAGVPVAIKDNLCVADRPMTCGSRMLETYRPPRDACVVERLREADAILFGKTNLDEFGMGSSTEHSAFGPTCNPYDPARTPGGSSGGSAAAVAAGLVPLALGTDTGGSIRQPAAFCGIVGLKPTYGLVSRRGMVAFASSLDQIGPLARSVPDAALLLQVIAGHDASDATSSVRRAPRHEAVKATARGVRIGLPREFFPEALADEVRAAVGAAQAVLVRGGAEIREVKLPLARYAVPTYYLVASCEAASNLARYDGVRFGLRAPGANFSGMVRASRGAGFGEEVQRRILLGTFALSRECQAPYYHRAQQVRAAMRAEIEAVFEQVDLLLAPTTPSVAFPLGKLAGDPVAMYAQDILTVTANLAGIPGVSLPCGRSAGGLPIGLQLLGPRFGEQVLLQAARAYEEAGTGRGPWWPPEATS